MPQSGLQDFLFVCEAKHKAELPPKSPLHTGVLSRGIPTPGPGTMRAGKCPVGCQVLHLDSVDDEMGFQAAGWETSQGSLKYTRGCKSFWYPRGEVGMLCLQPPGSQAVCFCPACRCPQPLPEKSGAPRTHPAVPGGGTDPKPTFLQGRGGAEPRRLRRPGCPCPAQPGALLPPPPRVPGARGGARAVAGGPVGAGRAGGRSQRGG